MLISIPVVYEDDDEEKRSVIINANQVVEIREYGEHNNRCEIIMVDDVKDNHYIGAVNRFEMAEWINAAVLRLVKGGVF